MDDNTRENLREAIRDNMAGMVADCHAGIGYRVIEDRTDNIMAAIDEATPEGWVRVTPETMPPEQEPIVVRWDTGHDICRVIGTEWWSETGARFTPYTLPPTHWMLLPAPHRSESA